MWNNIVEFFNNNLWLQILLEGYLIFCIVSFIVYLIAYSKRAFYLVIAEILFLGLYFLTKNLNLEFTATVFKIICFIAPIFIICVLAPDFRNIINFKQDIKEKKVITGDNA
ncbi:membrane protein, partial [gut metagenome]